MLTWDNKRNCETTSEQCLALFKRTPKELLRRLVTADNPLMYTRDQGTVKTVDLTCSKKGKDCAIDRKSYGHFPPFLGYTTCDLHRLPEEGQNGLNVLLYRNVEKTAAISGKVLLHHDNAPARTSTIATSKLGYKLVPHPPYSPNLTSN